MRPGVWFTGVVVTRNAVGAGRTEQGTRGEVSFQPGWVILRQDPEGSYYPPQKGLVWIPADLVSSVTTDDEPLPSRRHE